MKILVTGGAGFIGSAIVPTLQKLDNEIFVYDNLSFGNRKFIGSIDDKHFILADILDAEKLNNVIKNINPEVIIHLAAIHFIPYCNEHPFESADINIRGTMNVLNASKSAIDLKILLTGFGPFEGVPINPTKLIIEAIKPSEYKKNNIKLDTLVLEVSITGADRALSNYYKNNNPDVVIHMGIAANEDIIRIERIALNLDDFRIPDNKGKTVLDKRIVEN